ncbi:unnamed protein product [Litomosoides sigmodontis]|uniref:Uncharacterized protein n=1 Tax=Litomosoides sigmodontis TaxID=42156 RepID=A0A3P6SKC5_LITSI|nr:unnamed protein product [Litomosoides sigmodontis]
MGYSAALFIATFILLYGSGSYGDDKKEAAGEAKAPPAEAEGKSGGNKTDDDIRKTTAQSLETTNAGSESVADTVMGREETAGQDEAGAQTQPAVKSIGSMSEISYTMKLANHLLAVYFIFGL